MGWCMLFKQAGALMHQQLSSRLTRTACRPTCFFLLVRDLGTSRAIFRVRPDGTSDLIYKGLAAHLPAAAECIDGPAKSSSQPRQLTTHLEPCHSLRDGDVP